MTYRDDVLFAKICNDEGNTEDAEQILRQILLEHPVRIRKVQIKAWLCGNREFLKSLNRLKEGM